MNKGFLIGSFSMIAILVAGEALASHQDIVIGVPVHGGSGCKQASEVSVEVEDERINVLLPDMVASTYGGKRLARSTCNIAVPIQLSPGKKLIVTDYASVLDLDVGNGAVAQVNAEIFLAGSKGPRLTKTFRGSDEESQGLTLVQTTPFQTVLATACGATTNLRLISSITAQRASFGFGSSIEQKFLTLGFQVIDCD